MIAGNLSTAAAVDNLALRTAMNAQFEIDNKDIHRNREREMEKLQEPVRVPQKESTDRSAAFPAYDSVRQSQGAYVVTRHHCDVTVLCAALSGGETTRNMGHDKSIIRTHKIDSSK